MLKWYESMSPIPFYKISQFLPAHNTYLFSDASAETTSTNGTLVLRNGFGAIFGEYAIVHSWSDLLPILQKLGHFDEREDMKWSSTKAEQIAALFSLFTILEAGVLPKAVKLFNVLEPLVLYNS